MKIGYHGFGAKIGSFWVVVLLMMSLPAVAGGKAGIYGIRMVPDGKDAERFSRPGWGGGFHAVMPFPQVGNIFALTTGFEIINLLDQTLEFQEEFTGLRVEQHTNQHYLRIFLGGQVGGHGNGFIRPHAGVNLAIVNYGISTELIIPDDFNPDNEIRQDLGSENHWVLGYDITLGVDLNFNNKVALDGGVRYLKSFSVPQQLGHEDAVRVHPQYFQIYLGIGVSFRVFNKS
ncbi:MAG: hypothetical protein D6681_04055 [Calditrichaeota bacterium]|nr:MAG: hypothetical protein D6681_04055 [Calditrichota bacterium]